jgi:hypothetical protein
MASHTSNDFQKNVGLTHCTNSPWYASTLIASFVLFFIGSFFEKFLEEIFQKSRGLIPI